MSIDFNQFGKSQKMGGGNAGSQVATPIRKTGSIDFNQFNKSGITSAAVSPEVNVNNPSFEYNKDDSLLKSGAKAIGNVPSSVWGVAKGLGNMVLHPIDTAEGIGKIVSGGVQKLTPGVQDNEQNFDALVNFFKDRYGSVEGFKKTLVEDPAGIALDISTLFTGGGAAATKLGSLTKINQATKAANVLNRVGKTGEALKAAKAVSNIGEANALTETGKFLSKAGDIVNPINQGVKLVGKGVEAATKGRQIGGSKYTAENLGAAGNIGITPDELPIFARTNSPIAQTAEAVASKGLGGKAIWDRMTNVYTKMNDTVDSLVKGKLDAATIGKNITDAVDGFKSNFHEIKNDLYKKAIIPNPKETPIFEIPGFEKVKTVTFGKEDPMFATWNKSVLPDGKIRYTKPTTPLFSGSKDYLPADTTKTQQLLQSLIEKEKQANKGYGVKSSSESKTYEGLLKGLGSGKMTTSDVYRTLQKLSDDIKYGTTVKTGNNAKLSLIRETLDNEFMTTLQKQRPDLAEALAKADEFYKQGVAKLNSGLIQAIVKNADKPDLIVKSLLPRLTSLEDVKLLVEVIGQKNMVELRKSILSEIFTEAKGVAGENLQPLGISKQIKKFGEDKLEILLNPDQLAAVKDLEQLSKMMGKSARITGGSQTSFNLLSTVGEGSVATAAALLAMGNLQGAVLVLAPLFGTIAAGKFINSTFGRKILAEGIEFSGKTGRKLQSAAPAMGTGAQVGQQLNNLYNYQGR